MLILPLSFFFFGLATEKSPREKRGKSDIKTSLFLMKNQLFFFIILFFKKKQPNLQCSVLMSFCLSLAKNLK